jgi:hypothetical protein
MAIDQRARALERHLTAHALVTGWFETDIARERIVEGHYIIVFVVQFASISAPHVVHEE